MMKKHVLIVLVYFFYWFSVYGKSPHNYIGSRQLYYGAAYYPEAWNMIGVEEDIRRMKELRMNVVRMAEFSWSLMEPSEGKFDFDWLHKIIEQLHSHGIHVILGTPTATPPAWLGEKYPTIYRIEENNNRLTHGGRRNCNYASTMYRKYCEKICLRMAMEFGNKPGVIGWQIDNEFNYAPDYGNETKKRWHAWLQKRYGSIQNLNNLWCTQLWSQSYSSFTQIPMPTSGVWHHPSLQMAWYRFTNDMILEFQQIQVDAIRKYSSLPITHDGMPGQKINYEKIFDGLDYMAVNNYHSFEAYDRIQSNYDRMRGYGKGMFWLFETAPNYSGGGEKGNTWFLHQPDGSMRAALWMNYAMGAQGAMFWLWKQHWAGHEMPHGAIISSWNKPAANYDDLRNLGIELEKYSHILMDNPVAPAQAAIIWSHENLFAFSFEEYANGINYYSDWTYRFYRSIADVYLHRDVITPQTNISQYKLLCVPLMPFISEHLRLEIKKWVEQGGVLLLGPMSAYRTEEWTSFTQAALGDMEEWTGITVDSRIPIGTKRRDKEIPLMLNYTDSSLPESSEASLWSEALSSRMAKVLATYNSGMHKNKPAIMESTFGKGKIVFLGTDPGTEVYQALVIKYAKEAGINMLLASGDKGVVIVPRTGDKELLIVVNIANETKNILLQEHYTMDMISGQHLQNNSITLSPFQVMLLTKH